MIMDRGYACRNEIIMSDIKEKRNRIHSVESFGSVDDTV